MGLRFGEWKKIPDFEYISVVGITLKSTRNTNIGIPKPSIISSNTTELHFGTYKIRFFKTYKQRMDIKDVNSQKRALKLAKKLAKSLDAKLLDATKKPPEFIDV